jgi:GNAT superfamily N-acetyltransferase
MEAVIRRAELVDFATARAIVSEYYQAAQVVARDSEEHFRDHYFSAKAGIFLAWDRNRVIGCIALRQMEQAHCAEIKRLYVRPAWRGRGIAQKLLKAAERFAKTSGYRSIYLDTAADMHAAARLYERSGYQPCQRYNDNPQAAIFMKKEL